MRSLVTGAAGFIGSHLVRRLRAEGWSVTGVDRRPGADLQADLLTADLEPLLDRVQVVFHLAGQPGVRESWRQFPEYARGNVETTQRLLEALRGRPLTRFVLASTSSVYGQAPMPAREEGSALPVSPYGATKLAAEALCGLYGRTAGLPWVALRYFTVYGPGQRPDMAFTRWLTAARDGSPVQLYGAGDQVRDFTFVADVVEVTLRAATAPAAMGQPINVGGGTQVPIREAIRLIEAITGKTLAVTHLPPAPGDMSVTRADTTQLQGLLGFVPSTPLAEGLKQQWEWLSGAVTYAGGSA